MLHSYRLIIILFSILFSHAVYADITVSMYYTAKTGTGKFVGNIVVTQTKYGVLFTPNLQDLKPVIHGFHIHVNPSCNDYGMAASGHLDPQKTDKHLGPYANGHLGDLPVLVVNNDGTVTLPVLAPRLKLADIKNHALMIHEGGDNYADEPQKLGGGGNRMVCGVIQ